MAIINRSLQIDRATQIVRFIDCVRLGSFDVSVRVVKIVFTEKELGEGVMIPKQRFFPVGGIAILMAVSKWWMASFLLSWE